MSPAAQNRPGTAPLRVVGRPFEKGQSGNPGGRPKGLAARVREVTDDGSEIVDLMVGVLRDESASRKERMQAAEWLADRGWGRAVQEVRDAPAMTHPLLPDMEELMSMSREELERMTAELRPRVPVLTPGADSPGDL
jgi:hypothetical protein